ncbi:MAG: hypothetical protein NVS3B12_01000 [Acidimicrobiales bacterium]
MTSDEGPAPAAGADALDGHLDSISGVVAHGLLNSMSVVVGTMTTLADHWTRIDDAARSDLLTRGIEQALFVTDTLRDLVMGLPLGASRLLEELGEESERRHRRSADDL